MVLRSCRTDQGSLPIAVLLLLVGTSLSAVIASTTMSRAASVRATIDSSGVLDAAQAGFETLIARIRAAVDNAGQGSLVALPCGPLTGQVGPTGADTCLAAADPTLPGGDISIYGHDVSPAVTVACDGSTLEKWNADPNVLDASPLSLVAEK